MTKYLLLLTIFLAPLYVIRFNIGFLPSTLLEVLILFTLASYGLDLVREKVSSSELKERLSSTFALPALALLVVGMLAVLVAPNQFQALGLWRAYILEPVLIYLIASDLMMRGQIKINLVLATLASGAWIAVLGVLQKLTGQLATLESAHELDLGRGAAVFNSANAVALYLGPLVALSLILVRKYRWLIALLLIIFLLAFWASGSRGGILGLAAVAAVLAFGYLWTKANSRVRNWLKRYLIGLAVVSLAIASYLFINIDRYAPNQGIVYPRPYTGTTEVRLCLWEGTKNLITDNPVFGVGLAGFRVAYPDYRTCDSEELQYPHNIVLNVWTELGLAGVAVFIWIYYLAWRALFKSNSNYLVKFSLAAALIYTLAHGLVDVPYFKNDLSVQFWLLLSLVAVVRENKLRFD